MAGWIIGDATSARKNGRLQTLQDGRKGSVSGVVARTQRGGLAGGWRRLCTHNSSAFDWFAKAKHCARANIDPPRTHRAPRRPRRSPLCARGEAKVSCGPRSGVGGGVRKTGGCRIGQGLGSASGQGSGQVWACGHFSTGFPPAQRRCIGASGSEPPRGSSVDHIQCTLRPPLMNLL